jgi:hypothetical protein
VRELLEGQLLAEVATSLQKARSHVDTWPIEHDGFSVLMGGLWRVYKRGRYRHAIVSARFDDENVHEWRKHVRYLWYHLRILRPCWSNTLRDLASSSHDLSNALRDNHNLAELQCNVGDESLALTGLIDQRRAELWPVVRSLSQRVYAKEPVLFAAQIADHWRAWRHNKKEYR